MMKYRNSGMKYKHFIFLALLFLWFNACKRQCTTIFLNRGLLATYDSLTDSTAFIVKCVKGTNFSKVKDTTTTPIYAANPGVNNYAPIGYDFSDAAYDYLVTILPSGRVYKITNIHYGEEKANEGCGGSNWTSCSYGYSVNGTVYFTGAASHDDNNSGSGSVSLSIQ